MFNGFISVVGLWNIPLIVKKLLPVVRPVVFTPDIEVLNVCAIPVNSCDTSSKIALDE